jgi:tetratricopeptide (TPR) repeat protein
MNSARSVAWRAGVVLAAALTGGIFAVTAAMADYASDSKDCFAVGYGGQKRVDACTRVIASGRLKGKDLAGALQTRAEGYRITKQYEAALADFDRAIALDPKLAKAYANRAEVHRMLGHYDQVIADTTQAIRLDPSFNAFYTVRALAYEQQGNLAGARADYDKALAIPAKGADGDWAQDVARDRLKVLANK